VAVGLALGSVVLAACHSSNPVSATASTTTTTARAVSASVTTTVPLPKMDTANWVETENAKAGTTAWRITSDNPAAWIDGYADTTSARQGDTVELFVDTIAPTWSASAYRMGWYGGAEGRLVWTSTSQPGRRQAKPYVDPKTHMAEARWEPSLAVPITSDWPPGTYLIVLSTDGGGHIYVPLTVRDDNSTAALVLISEVTTFQAYNPWGGCSLYTCPGLKGVKRADVVSFDRPIARTYAHGSANFIDSELPLIGMVEQLGLDVTYVTDIDVHRDPSTLLHHRAVLTLGHDEYYSRSMRDGIQAARDQGVNLAFFGSNAMYRAIRLEPSWDGRPYRREVNYRSMKGDAVAAKDPKQATVQWRDAPLKDPEASIVGIQYGCAPMQGDMRIANPDNWIFDGTGAKEGTLLPGLIASEFDAATRSPSTPSNLELLAHSAVRCLGKVAVADSSWYSAPSGAGVFASGTNHWICAVDRGCADPASAAIIRRATINILSAFAEGPAGAAHPSVPNLRSILAEPRPSLPPAHHGGTTTTVANDED
jgi:hypothetical protein